VENHRLFTDVLVQKPRGFSDEISGFISTTCKVNKFSNPEKRLKTGIPSWKEVGKTREEYND
jgi:hypothetical protein